MDWASGRDFVLVVQTRTGYSTRMPIERDNSTLGPYEVIAQIGVGGMGEVYRARDTRLDRDVAIKVLHEAFAADPERIARFQREARPSPH